MSNLKIISKGIDDSFPKEKEFQIKILIDSKDNKQSIIEFLERNNTFGIFDDLRKLIAENF